jgi:hypothetical protein
MLRLTVCLLTWLLCSLSVLAQESASGQQNPRDDTLRAALGAYESGDLELARALFEAVHADDPSARTLRGLGIVAYRQGRYVDAVRLLEQSLSSSVRPLTEEMSQSVGVLLHDAGSRVGRLELVLVPSAAEVRIAGKAPVRDGEGLLLLAPGNHALELSAPGHAQTKLVVSASAGASERMEVELPALPVAPPAALPSAPTSVLGPHMVEQPRADSRRAPGKRTMRLRRTAYALAGVSGAALLVSGVATGLGIKRVHDIEDDCRNMTDHQCTLDYAQKQEREHNTKLLSILSIGGAVLGAAAAAGSGGLWLAVSRERRGDGSGGTRALLGGQLFF